jgi:hypothetical protein
MNPINYPEKPESFTEFQNQSLSPPHPQVLEFLVLKLENLQICPDVHLSPRRSVSKVRSLLDMRQSPIDSDLPLNFHPAAIGAMAVNTPSGAV